MSAKRHSFAFEAKLLTSRSKTGATPSVSLLDKRNPMTGRPGSAGRPLCAASSGGAVLAAIQRLRERRG